MNKIKHIAQLLKNINEENKNEDSNSYDRIVVADYQQDTEI